MNERSYLLSIGIMTGNSLDGADLVLSRFDTSGTISDLSTLYKPYPASLRQQLQELRLYITASNGRMTSVDSSFKSSDNCSFDEVQKAYTGFLAAGVAELKEKASSDPALSEYNFLEIDLIGSHGQTCAHRPPSIAGKAGGGTYTVQIGDGHELARLTGITVVCDFRSDDLMNGGEAAPLAPAHHQHLGRILQDAGYFPVAFCNGGNTGNITLLSHKIDTDATVVLGWDAGPFNHYPDQLIQKETGEHYDRDARIGARGKINLSLLRNLFETGVITDSGSNFLHIAPPRSSDPQWYLLPEMLTRQSADISFEDRVRTATYFAVYILAHSLSLVDESIIIPSSFAVCGGGWKNPLCLLHLRGLLEGNTGVSPVLPEHEDIFKKIRDRIGNRPLIAEHSSFFGIDGAAMEARIFADAAVCRVRGEHFSFPETTGVKQPSLLGVICFPEDNLSNATVTLQKVLQKSGVTPGVLKEFRWSRACGGWSS